MCIMPCPSFNSITLNKIVCETALGFPLLVYQGKNWFASFCQVLL